MTKNEFKKEFEKLDDEGRWKLVIENRTLDFQINIDNDSIDLIFIDELEDEDIDILYFDEFGYSAVKEILCALHIRADLV